MVSERRAQIKAAERLLRRTRSMLMESSHVAQRRDRVPGGLPDEALELVLRVFGQSLVYKAQIVSS